jgi:hypothetical protein
MPLDAIESAWKDDTGWTIIATGDFITDRNQMRWSSWYV